MVVYTPFTDEDLESQRGQEWPKRGDQEEARTRSQTQDSCPGAFPLHCGCLAFFVLGISLAFLPTPKQPPTDTPDSQLSLVPAAADQPGWLKSLGATAMLNMERRAGCSGSKLLAVAQVSFKEMINYGTQDPRLSIIIQLKLSPRRVRMELARF